PTPPPSNCAAGQKKCVANKVKAELGCYGKAAKSGTAVDPTCLSKANTKFSDPATGCMAKLELKTPNDCITTGQTATLESKVDAFSLDVFSEEAAGATTTTAAPTTPTAPPTPTPAPPTTPTTPSTTTTAPSTTTTTTPLIQCCVPGSPGG